MPAFSVGKTHMNLVSLMHWWWAFEGLVWLFEKSGEYCVVLQGLCLLWYTFTATQLPTWGTTFCTNTLNFGYTPLCFNMYKVVRGIDIGMQHVVEVIGFLLFLLIKVDATLSPQVLAEKLFIFNSVQFKVRYCVYLPVQFPTHITAQKRRTVDKQLWTWDGCNLWICCFVVVFVLWTITFMICKLCFKYVVTL